MKFENDTNVQQYTDVFMCSDFSPLINTPKQQQVSNTIDQIWCNVISENASCGIINCAKSVHMTIFASVSTSPESVSGISEFKLGKFLV